MKYLLKPIVYWYVTEFYSHEATHLLAIVAAIECLTFRAQWHVLYNLISYEAFSNPLTGEFIWNELVFGRVV